MGGPVRFGRYDLLERLAVGGMGELYLARVHGAKKDRPPVVLKILVQEYRENPDFLRMFQDEARIGMQLAHPNVVGAQEAGDFEGTPFIVLEYVDGENLRNVLRALAERRERMPAEMAVRIGIDVLLGLDHAHRAKDEQGRPLNLVHRDLSPDNVVLSWDGDVKILDFGIAKAEGRATRTQFGVLKGKGQYMAPEQALGNEVDARSDLYAVALVLLEAITGEKRFDNDDVVKQIVEARTWKPYGPSERDRSLPVELDAILLKALQADPDRRWQTADEFAAALTRLLRSGSLPRQRESLPALLARLFPKRSPREDDRPTSETVRGTTDDEGTVPGLGPDSEDERTVLKRPVPRASPRDEPTMSPRRAVNLAERSEPEEEDEATAAGRATGFRQPAPTDPGPRRVPVGAVREPEVKSDPGWAKNAARVPEDFATAVTDRGAAWSPDTPEEQTGETAVPTVRRGSAGRRFPAKKRRRILPRLFLLVLVVGAAGAATWTGREHLPPEARARLESLRELPVVERARSLAAERGWLAGGVPAETPVDLVLATGTAGDAMAASSATPSPDPSPAEDGDVVIADATPAAMQTATPSSAVTPEATATAVAVRTATPRATPRTTPAVKGASVKIVSTPPGHEILVDGRGTGKRTPATVIVPAGSHVLSIEAEGFKVWSFQEELRDGDTVVLQANLVPR